MTAAAIPVGRRSPATSGALSVFVALVTLGPLLLLNLQSEASQDVRVKGAILWVLCLLPSVMYVRQRPERRPPVPIFPLIGGMHAVYYALPALVGAVNLAWRPNQTQFPYLDPRTEFSTAIELVLWGWIMTLAGYTLLPLFFRPKRRVERSWPIREIAPWLKLMIVVGLLASLAQTVFTIPGSLVGPVGFIGVLSRFAMGTMLALRARRQLSRRDNLILLIAIPTQIALIASSGSIGAAFFFVLFLIVARFIGGGRLRLSWLLVGIAAAVPFIAIKGVLSEYRRQVWYTSSDMGVTEKNALLVGLLRDEVDANGVAATVANGWEVAVSRSATLDLLAIVVHMTPRDIPYWGGETYVWLMGVWVPRVIWPSKPTMTLGQDFGHRYNFLHPTDVYTSINLPFLVEFYANFGAAGVLAGMFIVGLLYRLLDLLLNVPGQSILRSLASLAIMLPLLNIESDFGLAFGGLFLNTIAFYAVLRFLGGRVTRGAGRSAGAAPAALGGAAAIRRG